MQGVLGVGALCEVLEARDSTGLPVVLKKLHRHCALDPLLVAMFCHEAQVMTTLDHPGLPRLLAYGCDAGQWFLAQRHVPGVDLAQVMERSPGGHVAAGVAAVQQILAALDHAHTRTSPEGTPLEIVHRDVAPANVRVGPDGTVTLLDWGIATSAWRRDPDRGRMKGTRGYMAPEVVTGALEADARSDLFAVGVVLYETHGGPAAVRGRSDAGDGRRGRGPSALPRGGRSGLSRRARRRGAYGACAGSPAAVPHGRSDVRRPVRGGTVQRRAHGPQGPGRPGRRGGRGHVAVGHRNVVVAPSRALPRALTRTVEGPRARHTEPWCERRALRPPMGHATQRPTHGPANLPRRVATLRFP